MVYHLQGDIDVRKTPISVEGEDPSPDIAPSQELLPESSAITIAFLTNHFNLFIKKIYRKHYSLDDSTTVLNNLSIPSDAQLAKYNLPSKMEIFFDMEL